MEDLLEKTKLSVLVFSKKVKSENEELRVLIVRALEEIVIYLMFLKIVVSRLNITEEDYRKRLLDILNSSLKEASVMDEEDKRNFEERKRLNLTIRMEIEEFYLFAHILLNKSTNVFENYLQHSFKKSLPSGSFHQFWKEIRKNNSFTFSDDLDRVANSLQKDIVSHRDHLITHTVEKENKQKQLNKAISWSSEGFSTLSSELFPKDGSSKSSKSQNINALVKDLCFYVEEYLLFLKSNINKSNITLD